MAIKVHKSCTLMLSYESFIQMAPTLIESTVTLMVFAKSVD